MSWRENQRPATFRGVPFFTDTNEREGGRRTVTHEFPFSEDPDFTEDLGMKGRAFTVEGYVLGNDYEAARDKLLTALETPGPGELKHAQFGVRTVAVLSYRVRETRVDGGLATFSIDFVETKAKVDTPTVSVNTTSAATYAVGNAKTSLSAAFLAKYVRLPAFFTAAAGGISTVSRALAAILDVKTLGAQQVAALTQTLSDISENAGELARAPADAIASLISVFDSLTDALIAAASSPSKTLLSLFGLPLGDSAITAAEAENMAALDAAVKRLVIVSASSAVLTEPFPSYDEAVAARDAVLGALDTNVDEVTDDAYPSLLALRVALVNAVPGPDSDLPRLQYVTLPASLPSLVVAHRLYGDVDSELELVARNRLQNPIITPGGQVLEVLTRE